MAAWKRWLGAAAVIVLLLIMFATGWVVAKTGIGAAMDPASLPEVERRFVEQMRGAALVGRFTIRGREDRAHQRAAERLEHEARPEHPRARVAQRAGDAATEMGMDLGGQPREKPGVADRRAHLVDGEEHAIAIVRRQAALHVAHCQLRPARTHLSQRSEIVCLVG